MGLFGEFVQKLGTFRAGLQATPGGMHASPWLPIKKFLPLIIYALFRSREGTTEPPYSISRGMWLLESIIITFARKNSGIDFLLIYVDNRGGGLKDSAAHFSDTYLIRLKIYSMPSQQHLDEHRRKSHNDVYDAVRYLKQ